MKKTLTGTLALLAGAYAVHAQGTVNLNNYGTGAAYLYVSYKSPTGVVTPLGGSATTGATTLNNFGGTVQDGNDWTVTLYGGAGTSTPSASLSPLGISATFSSGGLDPVAGTWFSTANAAIANAGYNGTVATVQLFAWYSGGGATLAQAEASSIIPWGESSIANITLGGPFPPGGPNPGNPAALPGVFNQLGNFNVATATPEPSTIALGVIGASAFLMRLRRKQ
jgi:hypothetical protein